MKNQKKLLALLLALLLLASSACLLVQARHACLCEQEDCPVCGLLALCGRLLQTLLLPAAAFSALWGAERLSLCFEASGRDFGVCRTLVNLKVKLSA